MLVYFLYYQKSSNSISSVVCSHQLLSEIIKLCARFRKNYPSYLFYWEPLFVSNYLVD